VRIENNRWQLNSRDIWHGVKCRDHCLKISMAAEAEVPEVLARLATHKDSDGDRFRIEQGNEYEVLRFAELTKNLGSDFVALAEYSDIAQTVGVARMGKPVIGQAQLTKRFDEFDFNGRADLLVRSDYTIQFLEDGTLTAVQMDGIENDGKYRVWEIKHASQFDSKGKAKDISNYKNQLAMNIEALQDMGLASDREAGIVFKLQDLAQFDPHELVAEFQTSRVAMFEYLSEISPSNAHSIRVDDWRCAKKSLCDDARCDYPDICAATRIENDEISQLYKPDRTHPPKFLQHGFDTIAKIADGDLSVTGINSKQLDRHKLTAQAIVESKALGKPVFKVMQSVWSVEKALPRRIESDLFVDFEWYTPLNSREDFYYMFGSVDVNEKPEQFTAVTGVTEEQVFMKYVNRVETAIKTNPDMHLFIASNAEDWRTKALGVRYGLSDERISAITSRYFDLQACASQALALSTGSFGLKSVEKFYMPAEEHHRETQTADGEGSLWMYHEYLRHLGAGEADKAIGYLDDIKKYNIEDCRSTKRFYDWLASI
jgi:predicted RecB family nuclease